MSRLPTASDARDVVLMVDTLPGFEFCRRYVLMSSGEIEPFTYLQGLDEPRPAFLVIDPAAVVCNYERHLSDADRSRLGADANEPLLWLALVGVDRQHRLAANLRAPIVVNPRTMTGLQVISADFRHPIDQPVDTV